MSLHTHTHRHILLQCQFYFQCQLCICLISREQNQRLQSTTQPNFACVQTLTLGNNPLSSWGRANSFQGLVPWQSPHQCCHDGVEALLSGRSHQAPKALQPLCRWKHSCCCLTVPTGMLYFILHPRQSPQPWLCGALPSADIHGNWSPAQGGGSRVIESLPSVRASPTSKWAGTWFPSESASFGLGYAFLPPFVPFFQPITSTFATDTLALLMLLT